MAIEIVSGASSDKLTVDATSKAARVTLYDTDGREIAAQSKVTYAASGTFTPAATPSDLITIYGSASKTVRVLSMVIGTTNTAAGSQQFFLVKRSAVNTGGTFVPATMVPMISTDPGATATVGHYTADPTPGTAVGTINTVRVASTVVTPTSFAGVREISEVEMVPWNVVSDMDRLLTLLGVAQGLAINFNDVALVAGQTHCYRVIWIEES